MPTLQSLVDSGKRLQGPADALRARHESNIGNISSKIQRIQAGANAAVQRDGSNQFGGGPRGFSRQLSQAEQRGKIRAGINARGENAVKNQQLKDRLQTIRGKIGRRGVEMGNIAERERIKAGGDAASVNIRSDLSAQRSSAIGGVIGAGFGAAKDFFNTGSLGKGIMDQQAEVDSFFDTGDIGQDNTFGGGFDFAPTNQMVG